MITGDQTRRRGQAFQQLLGDIDDNEPEIVQVIEIGFGQGAKAVKAGDDQQVSRSLELF